MSNAAHDKSLESWIWDAACSIRGAQEAPKFKDFILPLIFTKRLCDVFDDELNRIAVEVGSRAKAFKLVEKDHKLVRFYLPLKPQDANDAVWSVIRKLTGKIGESLTTYLHDIAKANPALEGIIDRMDFNATTHGQRDIDGTIEIGDTFKNPKFRVANRLQTFDRVVSNPMWNQDWFKEEDYDADELGRFPQGAGFPGAQSADWGWAQHILASLGGSGRAAIVLDTGAASRGSGNANKNKEKAVRQWFIEEDLIEGVIYLPENLFYNTPAPGILLFLNRSKPKDRRGKLFLVNASQVVEKGDPKNFIPPAGIERIATAFLAWQEEEKLAEIVTAEQVAKEDYNISPSRYIHVADAETHRPIAEILEEFEALDAEAAKANGVLRSMLEKVGL